MNEKPKNDRPRINNLIFFLLWIVLSAVVTQIGWSFSTPLQDWATQRMGQEYMLDNLWQFVFLSSLIALGFRAFIEKILMKLNFKYWITGWISSRLFSEVLRESPFILWQPFQSFVMNDFQRILYLIVSSFLAAFVQVWVLRPYVKNSWPYAFAVALSAFIPVILWPILPILPSSAYFITGISSAVMALTTLWLFSHPISEEKTKRAEAQNFERLEASAPETDSFEEEQKHYENQLD